MHLPNGLSLPFWFGICSIIAFSEPIKARVAMPKEIFIGRSHELAMLKSLLNKKSASLVLIKGRRRVGKSRLVKEFAKGYTLYAFEGLAPQQNTTAQSERDEFARQLGRQTGLPAVTTDDWSQLFLLLASQVQTGRKIIFFDEISWMGSKDEMFLPKLRAIWESHFKNNPQLLLILCGSVSTWIEENIQSSTGYFGRVSWTLTLRPLLLTECNQFLELLNFKYSAYEKFKILAITGGIPWYIEQIQGTLNADENIKRQCFNEGGVLVDDFDRIFHDLFDKKGEQYQKIISALADSPLTYDEIATATQYSSSGRLSDYLSELIEAGFVSRHYTLAVRSKKKSRLSLYRIRDNYIRFYLKYIKPNREKIANHHFDKMIISSLPGWESIMGYQYESLVLDNRQKLWELLGIDPKDILFDNPYFQRKSEGHEACQIDYLIQTRFGTYYLFEIKFSCDSIKPVIITAITKKIERLQLGRGAVCLPVLIHVNGVSDRIIEKNFFSALLTFRTFFNYLN